MNTILGRFTRPLQRARWALPVVLGLAGCEHETPTQPRVLSGSVTIRSQADLDALTGVELIDGSLLIESRGADASDPVTSLAPLGDLTTVTHDLRIDDIDSLRSLHGLERLRSIGSNFYIGHNDNIRTLAPLGAVQHFGIAFFVQDDDRLQSLDGLQGMRDLVGTFVQIALNDSLESLHGLDNLTSLTSRPGTGAHRLEIQGNPRLATLAGLDRLQFTDGLWVVGNDVLTDISALVGLRALGELWIGFCPSLGNLAALAGLDSCSTVHLTALPIADLSPFTNMRLGSLDLEDLPITDLTAFARVVELYSLSLRRLPALTSLHGLEGLARLQYLHIAANPLLASLDGLGPIRPLQFVDIEGNASLCQSTVDAWLRTVVVEGGIMSHDNGACGPPSGAQPSTAATVPRLGRRS